MPIGKDGVQDLMLNGNAKSYLILHGRPEGLTEALWRNCLADADFPTHYTAPEYFSEPSFRDKGPFAVLSLNGEKVTAVLTGINDGAHVQSGCPYGLKSSLRGAPISRAQPQI
jgi:hypothetical protein